MALYLMFGAGVIVQLETVRVAKGGRARPRVPEPEHRFF